MLIPKKLLILQKLTSHLEGIVLDDGSDMTGRVFRGRNTFTSSDPLPALSILEFPKPDPGNFAGWENTRFKEDWMLLVQGWVTDDRVNPTDPAYGLGVLVQQRLSMFLQQNESGSFTYPDIARIGGLATHMYIGPFTVRPPEAQVSSTAYFFLPLRVGVVTDVTQPFVEA